MQRLLASALLAVLSIMLALPLALASDAGSQVPECCRANGKHRCLMSHRHTTNNGGASFDSISAKCSFFPAAGIVTAHGTPFLPASRDTFFGNVLRHPACHAQTQALYRISFNRTRQKRGPPSLA